MFATPPVRFLIAAALALTVLGGPAAPPAASDSTGRSSEVEPLAQAHAHNDYEHPRPLLDALDHGFTSVEADVWLVDGELLVAHDLATSGPAGPWSRSTSTRCSSGSPPTAVGSTPAGGAASSC